MKVFWIHEEENGREIEELDASLRMDSNAFSIGRGHALPIIHIWKNWAEMLLR